MRPRAWPRRFFALAVGRTNVLSRDTLRFCEAVGNYFPKSLKVSNKLRATLSRAITAGVASTFNDAARRMQLAAINPVAFSMALPASKQTARRNAAKSSARPATVHSLSSQTSAQPLVNRLAAFVLRDDYRTFSPSVPDSRISSQRSRGPDDDVEESPL